MAVSLRLYVYTYAWSKEKELRVAAANLAKKKQAKNRKVLFLCPFFSFFARVLFVCLFVCLFFVIFAAAAGAGSGLVSHTCIRALYTL